MTRKFIVSSAIAMLTTIVGFAQNFTATYSFDSVKISSGSIDPTPVPISVGVAFGTFSATGASVNSNASNRFSFTNWPAGAISGEDTYSSLTGFINTSEYYEVSIEPENGYVLDLTDITFSVQRSGTGIRTYVVRSSADGYSSNLSASVDPANNKLTVHAGDIFFWTQDATTSNQNGSTITLGGINFTALSVPVTFRFYGYNSEGTTGTFSIDNVTFKGTANVVTSIANTIFPEITSVYPNPSVNGFFIVDIGVIQNSNHINVYNSYGKIIFEQEVSAFSKSVIDLSDKTNGIYFIGFKNDKATNLKKIIINK